MMYTYLHGKGCFPTEPACKATADCIDRLTPAMQGTPLCVRVCMSVSSAECCVCNYSIAMENMFFTTESRRLLGCGFHGDGI